MSDYEDEDIVEAGYYVVTYQGSPKPQGPFATVPEMALAVGLSDYPDNGSLNPDDLLTP